MGRSTVDQSKRDLSVCFYTRANVDRSTWEGKVGEDNAIVYEINLDFRAPDFRSP